MKICQINNVTWLSHRASFYKLISGYNENKRKILEEFTKSTSLLFFHNEIHDLVESGRKVIEIRRKYQLSNDDNKRLLNN